MSNKSSRYDTPASIAGDEAKINAFKILSEESKKRVSLIPIEFELIQKNLERKERTANSKKKKKANEKAIKALYQVGSLITVEGEISSPFLNSDNSPLFLIKKPNTNANANDNTNTDTEIKIMTNSTISAAPVVSNFVFAYNAKDINKETKLVKGSLTIPSAWVKQNASIIPACMWTFGKNKCIQFEYMGNIRIVKVDSTNPNALIKNVSKHNAPIFQLVFSLNLETKKELRTKEVGQLPVVFYHANNLVGERTEVAVREFNLEQFDVKKLSLETIVSNYMPILERDFFVSFCSAAKTPVAKVAKAKPVVCEDKPAVVINTPVEKVTTLNGVVIPVEPPIFQIEVETKTHAQPKAKKVKLTKAQKKASDDAKRAERAAKLESSQQEARQPVKTDDQVKTEETVVNTINTNNTEEKTMDFQAILLMTADEQNKIMETFSSEDFDAFKAYAEANVDKIKPCAPVLNTNKNTEVKTMTNAPRSKAILNAIAAHEAQQAELNNTDSTDNINTEVKTMTAPKYDRSAAPMTQDELIEAMMAEDNTVAAANGQEKSEEIVEKSTNTNAIPNNKTMDNAKTSSRKLVSIELVVNIIAAIGGDCARKSHSVAKRTEKLNVLRNKNSKTISNVRGYGAIRTNSNDGSCFLDVNVFPETAMTVYNTNNRPVIIFHYDDNTQAIQSEANTEKFWRKVFHTSEETVIPNINPTLKVDLPANADVLCERIDAGTIQAVSIKFTNMDKKMFTYYSSDVSGRFIVYLKAAGDYNVSLLRDTVEVSDNFLNYNGEKGAVNNFAGASKTGRSGNNVAVVARPQVAAAQSNLYGMPSTAEVSKVVETVAPVAVVIDTEKETLRAENVALKAEVSELKTQIADLTAGQSRMEAMLAQLVAAQAVKTEEVSIPEIIEIVAPALPVEVVEIEAQQLARLEEERMNFFRACEYDNHEATGEETLDSDQYAELNKLDEEIKTFKWLMNIPVADRAAAIEARNAEKAAAIAENTKAYADFMTTGIVSDNLFG